MNEDIDPSLLSLALSLFLPSLYHPQIRVQILATICNILSKDPSLIVFLCCPSSNLLDLSGCVSSVFWLLIGHFECTQLACDDQPIIF